MLVIPVFSWRPDINHCGIRWIFLVVDGSLVTNNFNPGEHLHWWVIHNDLIVNRYNSKQALDISQASTDDGAEIIPYDVHGGDNQRWKFPKVYWTTWVSFGNPRPNICTRAGGSARARAHARTHAHTHKRMHTHPLPVLWNCPSFDLLAIYLSGN